MARLVLAGLIAAALAIVAVSAHAMIRYVAEGGSLEAEGTASQMQKVAFALLMALILYTAIQGSAA